MSTPPQNWNYKAYDIDLCVVEGQTKAVDFQNLALTLRQQGLQVIEATALDPNNSLAGDRLNKMKRRIEPPDLEPETPGPRPSIRSWVFAAISLFRRG
jgi:type II secretory pathway component PulF